jgi:hypothetical protein
MMIALALKATISKKKISGQEQAENQNVKIVSNYN